MAARHDRAGRLAPPTRAKLYEGVAGRAHKPGDALVYEDGEEYRRRDQVANIVRQLPGKPFTLGHPPQLIRAGGQAQVIGHVVAARLDGDQAVCTVAVTDDAGEAAISAGTHELSLGYDCKVGQDNYQEDIDVDHLALVERARCGDQCSLRTDASRVDCTSTCACNSHATLHSVADMDPTPSEDATLTGKQRSALPAGKFAVPSRQVLPIEDVAHVRAAMARFNQTHFESPAERTAAYHHIVARAHQLGVDPAGFVKEFGGKTDSKDASTMDDELKKMLTEALATAAEQKIRADRLEVESGAQKLRADTAEQTLAQAQVDSTNARKDAELATGQLAQAKLDGETAVATAKADALAERTRLDAEAQAKFDARVAARVKLFADATRILGTNDAAGVAIDRSAVSDRDLKCQVIKHVDGDDVDANAVEAYVDGVYEGAVKRHDRASASVGAARAAIVAGREDTKVLLPKKHSDAESEARAKALDKQMNRWRTSSRA